jgi:hypothetical protein
MDIIIEKVKATELKIGDMVYDLPAGVEDMPKHLAPIEFEVVNIYNKENVIVMKPMGSQGYYKLQEDGNVHFTLDSSGGWHRTTLTNL